ncbi:MAG: hypothetical protein REJ23_03590 [Brevundimonas sp.]|nr:hypothetical protein [Brevundimonas sp.]
MDEDRSARRNRNSPAGLWFLVGLALVAIALIVAVVFKSSAAEHRAREETEAAATRTAS